MGIAGLNASLKWIAEEGIDKIREREKHNRHKLLHIFNQYQFIHTVGISPDNEYVGVVSVLFDGLSSDSCGSVFDRLGISVRTGLQCAPLAHKFLNTYPAGTVRFSVGYFTNDEDFLALQQALAYVKDNI